MKTHSRTVNVISVKLSFHPQKEMRRERKRIAVSFLLLPSSCLLGSFLVSSHLTQETRPRVDSSDSRDEERGRVGGKQLKLWCNSKQGVKSLKKRFLVIIRSLPPPSLSLGGRKACLSSLFLHPAFSSSSSLAFPSLCVGCRESGFIPWCVSCALSPNSISSFPQFLFLFLRHTDWGKRVLFVLWIYQWKKNSFLFSRESKKQSEKLRDKASVSITS